MPSNEVDILKRALERQKKARVQAEKILEGKSKELYDTAQHLKRVNTRLKSLLDEKSDDMDTAFLNIIDPYVVMDLNFDVIRTNDSAKEFLEYSYEDGPLNLASLVHPEFLQYTKESMQSLLKVGFLKNYRAKIFTKNREEKYVQINASLIHNTRGEPIAAQGIIRDITEEMEVETLLTDHREQLDAERLKYRSIIANMNLGLIEVDTDDVIKLVNQSFCDMSGFTEEALIGNQVKDILYVKDKKPIRDKSGQRSEGKSKSYTLEVKNKDGETRYWLVSEAPTFDNKKQVVGFIGIHLDLTEHRLLELQKEQLLRKLEQSNKGLQEYAHIVSHDLKSPLRSISALATWIQEDHKGKLDETGHQNLNLMQEKIASMDKLIHGILEYSTANSSELKNHEVDLNRVLQEVKNTIYIPDHVSLKIPNELPTIVADRTKMHQLFQNIIANAVAHIECEKGIVEVRYKEFEDIWQFTISDNGVGIPEKFHKKIFEIFQSMGNAEKSTGIGLSIVKKIVDRYQGDVWVDSDEGRGTDFHFTLNKNTLTKKQDL